MIRDVTLGQYFPGDSVIHRMDPRMKIILTLTFIIELFIVQTFAGFAVAALMLVTVNVLSGISAKTVLRSLKPLLFVIILTAFFNIFYGGGDPLIPDVGWLRWLTAEGLSRAAFMALRIILLIIGTSFLTYTTSPVMLTDAIERLLLPLKFVKVPVHELAMMMTITMRFIPTLIDETERIMNAQKARGADFETGNIVRRAKALVPILVPLIVSSFKRAEELADAMECRCYNGGDGRTRYKIYKLSARDWIAALIVALSIAFIIAANVYL